jgi:hypothetical protein
MTTLRAPRSAEGAPPIMEASGCAPARWHEAWQVRSAHHPPVVRFDRPTQTLPISLTGSACALRCAHCNGHYLQHMRPIWEGDFSASRSLLISGGCDPQGRVPVMEHLSAVARFREGRRLNWHVGLINEEEMRALAPLVDVVSFDIVGDAATAREVYGLDLDLDDYLRCLAMIRRHAPVIPHLTIGLRGGRLSGELRALEALAGLDLTALILIILIPTPGTAYADCPPPALDDVAEVMLTARTALPIVRLTLGCMRPHGAYRQAVDELALHAGLNGIVNPTLRAERLATALGLEITWGDECCALP